MKAYMSNEGVIRITPEGAAEFALFKLAAEKRIEPEFVGFIVEHPERVWATPEFIIRLDSSLLQKEK